MCRPGALSALPEIDAVESAATVRGQVWSEWFPSQNPNSIEINPTATAIQKPGSANVASDSLSGTNTNNQSGSPTTRSVRAMRVSVMYGFTTVAAFVPERDSSSACD